MVALIASVAFIGSQIIAVAIERRASRMDIAHARLAALVQHARTVRGR